MAGTQDYVKRVPRTATTSKCCVSMGKRGTIGRGCPLRGSRLDGWRRPFFEHLVDQSEGLGLCRGKELVTFHGPLDFLDRPAGMVNVYLIQACPGREDLL